MKFLIEGKNMPIYTYKCKKCHEKFERLEGVVSEEEALKCSKCGSKDVQKVFSTFSVGKSSRSCDMNAPACSGCPGGACG